MIVFTFGAPQIVWLLYPKASVLVWLPVVLYFTLRLIRGGNWRDVAWLALVMAAQVVGGHPETALYSASLRSAFGGYTLWAAAKDGAPGTTPFACSATGGGRAAGLGRRRGAMARHRRCAAAK